MEEGPGYGMQGRGQVQKRPRSPGGEVLWEQSVSMRSGNDDMSDLDPQD